MITGYLSYAVLAPFNDGSGEYLVAVTWLHVDAARIVEGNDYMRVVKLDETRKFEILDV